ncbi:MAG: hypothetical protein A4E20_10970 [Nitrospira sp. SG-bin2]|nr:MAG: hypothetical protein A4E20_10970 [Nitrospira sp. SG-bin2]
MSRARAEELCTADGDYCVTYIGPRETGEEFCLYGSPTTLEACGFFEDTSEWICETIHIEPDWAIEFLGDHYSVYDRSKKVSWMNHHPWRSRDRAEKYIELLKEDWWDE